MSKTHHNFKIWPEFFKHVLTGAKRFEIRHAREGEPYAVGDTLTLLEYHNSGYTGRQFRGVIVYITDFNQKPHTYVLGYSEAELQNTKGWYD